MIAGQPYLASDPELVNARLRARRLWARFNGAEPGDEAGRRALLTELLGGIGARSLRRGSVPLRLRLETS
jgi:hypothetical protein